MRPYFAACFPPSVNAAFFARIAVMSGLKTGCNSGRVRPAMCTARRLLHRRMWKKLISVMLVGAMLPGCSVPKNLTYLVGESGPADYQDHVLEIDHPAVDQPTSDAVAATRKPRKVGDRSKDELWDL